MQGSVQRVMFICDKLGYPGGLAFGITTYFVHVLPELVRAGVQLTTCVLRDPHPAADELRSLGVSPKFLSSWRLDPTVAWRIARIARENRCTILHAAGIKATLMARVAARSIPARVIVHVHDQQDPGFPFRNLHRFLARPSDLGICVSRAVQAAAVVGYGIAPSRLRVIPNGIDIDRFRRVPAGTHQELRRVLGIDPHMRVVGMFGRLYPVKGHRTMLKMMPRIIESSPETVLLIAGDGPERGACERLVDRLGLRHSVMFLGHRGDIPELISTCELTVMTSETEGLPLAAIESLAMGKPVVAFDVGGMSEVIDHERTGRLVPYGDTDAFVDSIQAFLNDVDSLAEFGARAVRASQRFTVQEHVRLLLDCYREIPCPESSGSGGSTIS